MNAQELALWMQSELDKDTCLYQDDVVDFALKNDLESLLKENSNGNVVLSKDVLNEFKKLNKTSVVWVRPDKYWRFRVAEDENDRNARG
ncbi:ATP-dependent RNA helicase HrpA [Photobacterium leiognathi lrivu.4.1]|uniref:ATP-dependent RNA helicase HrpA n=1 Tax=Photobacterium leiognathi lrivu.4.1 TaxID=1248232 RepID=V5F7N4_PHOLE|nr:hypothetical protein [Photobacterium leiognathi]GAD31319.1 ATP-dependent RNA helicase HrpA [Photobacterium leiognathi lrivu.4.1]